MDDESEFRVRINMGMSIAFENVYGYGYEYGYRLLNSVPDLLVKGDKNMLKFKNKC